MPEGIEKEDWDVLHQLAVDGVNAAMMEDEVLMASRNVVILDYLEVLQKKYGDHPSILATKGDYLDDPAERKETYLKALAIAKKQNKQDEITEILESLNELE